MDFIRPFNQINKNDAAIAGGKGASLGEMTQAGIPVPEGFVILAGCFERFVEETDLVAEIDTILHTVNKQEMHTVEHASAKIQQLILQARMPTDIANEIEKNFVELGAPHVAVRSSATAEDSASAAWAGQLESYLNTTEKTLLVNVQRCWASLFTPRAIFYRFEKELHAQKISVAVVIQKMIESEVSGIAFSVHPVTEDRNQLIIEAGYGLGEAIVSGQITPDSYVVEKEPRRIIDTNVHIQKRGLYRAQKGGNEWHEIAEPQASAQVLSAKQILELAELIIKIEKHYGFPCDIEWAFKDNTFYVVQSRPITTLSGGITKKTISNSLLRKEDFVFTFESQGTSFLFEDIVANHYYPEEGYGEWVKTCVRGLVQVFASKETLKRMDIEGLSRTPADTRAAIDTLEGLIEKAVQELPHYRDKQDFGKADAVHMCKVLGDICQKYEYFDFAFWDSTFEASFSNADAKEKVQLVEGYKNEVRAKINSIFFDQKGYLQSLLQNISRLRSVPLEDLNWYTEQELIALCDGVTLSQAERIAREQCDAYHHIHGKTLFYSGETSAEIISLFKTKLTKGREIKGKMAHGTGKKVQGLVRVITRDYSGGGAMYEQMAAMKKGEVFVSETTDPELMEAFNKASAVVTDIGGMLSHAAITARELGLPCIVGTEVASKTLKTGDLVEVDAEAGVVRILDPQNPFGSIDNWQRLFRVQGLRFLIDDIWMEHYRRLSALTLIINDEYTSYLPRPVVEQTLAEGVALLSDSRKFEVYESEFEVYMKEFPIYASSLSYDSASKQDIEKLLSEIARLFSFYSKTEFFATDGAYKLFEETKDKNLEERLERMGNIKNNGRSFLNSVFFGADSLLPKLLKGLELRFGVSERELQQYSRVEIVGLFDGKQVSQEEIERRNNAFYIWGDGDSVLIKTGPEARKEIQAFIGEAVSDHGETIAGTSAHKGKARGAARIIRAGYDNFDTLHHMMDAMQRGDILVAETTSPELMPACQKAGGIITDQGGMLSHAAIVSRELNIPCVVGTSNATEAIKEGDLVEIDGDRGVVHIIERAQHG